MMRDRLTLASTMRHTSVVIGWSPLANLRPLVLQRLSRKGCGLHPCGAETQGAFAFMASSRKFVPTNCAHCGAAFLASEANVAMGNGRFCSRSCGGKARAAAGLICLSNLAKGHVKGPGKKVVKRNWRNAYPERFRAHLAVKAAIAKGLLVRMPCVVCGDAKTHGHHEDYEKRLDVVWLCQKHHSERHKELKRDNARAD